MQLQSQPASNTFSARVVFENTLFFSNVSESFVGFDSSTDTGSKSLGL